MSNEKNRSRKQKRRGAPKKCEIVKEPANMQVNSTAGCSKEATDEANQSQYSTPKKSKVAIETPERRKKVHENKGECAVDYNIIMHFEILKNALELVAVCPECQQSPM